MSPLDHNVRYRLAIRLDQHWVSFEDGVVLFNPQNSNTVLYHPVLEQLKTVIGEPQFETTACLQAVAPAQHQLIMDTLDSLESMGFIYRTEH